MMEISQVMGMRWEVAFELRTEWREEAVKIR